MHKIKQTVLYEAYTLDGLVGFVNTYLKENHRKEVVDIKFINPYKRDILPEFLDLHEDGKTEEDIFSAILLIGEEV